MSEYYEGPTYGIRDRQRDKPAHICEECETELFPGEKTYHVNGRLVCVECFKDWAKDLLTTSPNIMADRLGVDVQTLSARKEPFYGP